MNWNKYILSATSITAIGTYYFYHKLTATRITPNRNQIILITGCDSGFGFSLAVHCHKTLDMTVIACCHMHHNSDGRNALGAMGIHTIDNFDVTKQECIKEARKFVQKLIDDSGGQMELFCVVNNAAALVFAEVEWQTANQIDLQFMVNVVGPIMVIKELTPLLKKSKGRIINMTSDSARFEVPCFIPYSATKSALETISNGLRLELRKYGIKVILFNPGANPTKTPLCGRQTSYLDEMSSADMDPTIKTHFDRCSLTIKSFFPSLPSSTEIIQSNDRFYSLFTAAILDSDPSSEYVSADAWARLSTWAASTWWMTEKRREEIKLKMVPLPNYEEEDV